MPGKFLLFGAGNLVSSAYDSSDNDLPPWRRQVICVPKSKKFFQDSLQGRTGVAIFGPTQDSWLEAFLKSEVKILFKSKKCVNPNHKGYAPAQRNTVVVFEALE